MIITAVNNGTTFCSSISIIVSKKVCALVQFKMVSIRSEKLIYAPSRLSEVSPTLPLKRISNKHSSHFLSFPYHLQCPTVTETGHNVLSRLSWNLNPVLSRNLSDAFNSLKHPLPKMNTATQAAKCPPRRSKLQVTNICSGR